jgi:hypothetical protein
MLHFKSALPGFLLLLPLALALPAARADVMLQFSSPAPIGSYDGAEAAQAGRPTRRILKPENLEVVGSSLRLVFIERKPTPWSDGHTSMEYRSYEIALESPERARVVRDYLADASHNVLIQGGAEGPVKELEWRAPAKPPAKDKVEIWDPKTVQVRTVDGREWAVHPIPAFANYVGLRISPATYALDRGVPDSGLNVVVGPEDKDYVRKSFQLDGPQIVAYGPYPGADPKKFEGPSRFDAGVAGLGLNLDVTGAAPDATAVGRK